MKNSKQKEITYKTGKIAQLSDKEIEDKTRVEYIQKFIDDGYKLKWE